jgi:hypothetical protein
LTNKYKKIAQANNQTTKLQKQKQKQKVCSGYLINIQICDCVSKTEW